MDDGRDPTEAYDGRITVRIFEPAGGSRAELCATYREAIDLVKEHQYEAEEIRIVDRDGETVFSSIDTDIADWESVWEREKRRQGIDVEDHECPYDSVSCFPDDLCVECKMDKVQDDRRRVE